MKLHDAQFDLLNRLYVGEGKPALKAIALVEKSISSEGRRPNLDKILRLHSDDSPINDSDTYKRDEFDQCLSYYSLIEIAMCCGTVPGTLPKQYELTARMFLDHDAVRKYYRTNYPLLLPQAHLMRLNGNPVIPWGEFSGNASFSTFFEFTDFDRSEQNTPIEVFQWFLDNGERTDDEGEWRDIGDTLRAIAYPGRFVQCLADTDPDLTELSVQGLVEFLHFCRAFDEFLLGVQPKLLQSLYWNFFAYWFVRLKHEVGSTVRKAIDRLTKWEQKLADGFDKQKSRQFHQATNKYQQAVNRLCSPKHGREFTMRYQVVDKLLGKVKS